MKKLSIPQTKFDTFQIIIALLAAGIVLRVAGLTTSAIWFDESVSLYVSREPFISMLQTSRDMLNPPLWELIVWLSFRLFGVNEFGLRFPALVASIISLWLAYKLCVELGLTDKQKVAAMLFIALLPYQFWIAQDGRMYSLYSALYLGAAWFALKNRWLGLIATTGLLMYIHTTGVLYAISVFTIVASNNIFDRKHLLRVTASGLIVLAVFLPWLSIYFQPSYQALDYPKFSWLLLLAGIYEIMFANGPLKVAPVYALAGLLAITITTGFALIYSAKILFGQIIKAVSAYKSGPDRSDSNGDTRFMQITLLALMPVTIMILIGVFWKSIVIYRSLSATLVPLVIWLVTAIAKASPKWLIRWGFAPLWIVLLLTSVILWSPQRKTGDLREIVNLINNQWQAGDIVYHVSGTSLLPFSYYLSDRPAYLLDEDLSSLVMNPVPQDLLTTGRAPLESIAHQRAWIIYARDPLISKRANERIQNYKKNGTLVGIVQSWQFAPIEIYLVSHSDNLP
jgi:hypothetical protein